MTTVSTRMAPRGRGRPFGSKDRRPREKRTKLQYTVDEFLGLQKPGKRRLHVALQEPCESCGSCMRVSFQPETFPSNPVPPFIVDALAQSPAVRGG